MKTTVQIQFHLSTGGRPATLEDARKVGALFDSEDGDSLSLGGPFILHDVSWDDPQLFLGKLSATFWVDVSPLEGATDSPEDLATKVGEVAVLYLPRGYDVAKLTATVA